MRDKVLFSFLLFIYSAVAEHLTEHHGKIISDYLLVYVTYRKYNFFSADFECPENNGFFHDVEQCDLYYECIDNKRKLFPTTSCKIIFDRKRQLSAIAKLCPDGLLFDSKNPNQEKCDYPFNVDCGAREYVRK